MERITDFWESILFFKNNFKGDFIKADQKVEAENKVLIEAQYFGIWLNLWHKTLDTYYKGNLVQLAKNRACKLGTKII